MKGSRPTDEIEAEERKGGCAEEREGSIQAREHLVQEWRERRVGEQIQHHLFESHPAVSSWCFALLHVMPQAIEHVGRPTRCPHTAAEPEGAVRGCAHLQQVAGEQHMLQRTYITVPVCRVQQVTAHCHCSPWNLKAQARGACGPPTSRSWQADSVMPQGLRLEPAVSCGHVGAHLQQPAGGQHDAECAAAQVQVECDHGDRPRIVRVLALPPKPAQLSGISAKSPLTKGRYALCHIMLQCRRDFTYGLEWCILQFQDKCFVVRASTEVMMRTPCHVTW